MQILNQITCRIVIKSVKVKTKKKWIYKKKKKKWKLKIKENMIHHKILAFKNKMQKIKK
jgi:hypothetical protein